VETPLKKNIGSWFFIMVEEPNGSKANHNDGKILHRYLFCYRARCARRGERLTPKNPFLITLTGPCLQQNRRREVHL
jgi:hypothetical protein